LQFHVRIQIMMPSETFCIFLYMLLGTRQGHHTFPPLVLLKELLALVDSRLSYGFAN